MVETTGLHPQLDVQPLFPVEDFAVPCMQFARPEEADGVGPEQESKRNYSHLLQKLQFIHLPMRTERTRPQGTSLGDDFMQKP